MMMVTKLLCFLLFLSSLFLQILLAAAAQSKCNHEAEISALLQFKDEFEINCINYFPHPKTSSWNIESLKNNASLEWNGVECDPVTGHVIGLDLSSSCLSGSINSTRSSSSFFSHLVHLQHLNLAFNYFYGSSIPSELGNLWRLTYLNLSSSFFVGWVPLEISKLSMLSSLDLSHNGDLEMNLKRLVQNLTNLEELDLTSTALSSEVPDFFTNMSSLRSLKLDECGLYGEFPQGIFRLPNLKHLSIGWNPKLKGYLPDFSWSTPPLESILLWGTNFSGIIPAFANLTNLVTLDLSENQLTGPIPSALGNLTQLSELSLASNQLSGEIPPGLMNYLTSLVTLDLKNNQLTGPIPSPLGNLTQLSLLSLAYNQLTGPIPSALGNLTQLSELSLASNQLSGEITPGLMNYLTKLVTLDLTNNQLTGSIPSALGNLTQLSLLSLAYNQLTGPIPSALGNLTQLFLLSLEDNQLSGEIPPGLMSLTQLTRLDLTNNKLQGSIPLGNLTSIEYLVLDNNNLSGTLLLDKFFLFRNLFQLGLSSNNLTCLQGNISKNARIPNLYALGLSSCGLSEFPKFIRNQNELRFIDLSYNNIQGQIPNVGLKNYLYVLDLSHNLLTGSVDTDFFLQWKSLYSLDISFNKLQGSIPIPPMKLGTYIASNNEFAGELSYSICNSGNLETLDLSSNSLTGELPHCFEKFSSQLQILNLGNNSFGGKIPEFCESGNEVTKDISLNKNQFQGKIPRSLANCMGLEFFDIGGNLISDSFPSWLGSLPQLKVIMLRDNALHGSMGMPKKSSHWFSELRIIDLSRNNLSGKLPSSYFELWIAMKVINLTNPIPSYMGQSLYRYSGFESYDYSLIMYSKGTERPYLKILDSLFAIDLSSNRFEGVLPTSISGLRGLRFLNLSNNLLSGGIPSSLGNLPMLESLDLSSNSFSGWIPQQLTHLTFLSFFNASYNNLTGSIPQGRHFDTFQNDSYVGNPELCGNPLSRECGASGKEAQPPDDVAEKHDVFWDDINGKILWLVVSIGFGGGLVVGIVIENMVDLKKPILSFFWSRDMRRTRRTRRPLQRN